MDGARNPLGTAVASPLVAAAVDSADTMIVVASDGEFLGDAGVPWEYTRWCVSLIDVDAW